MKNKAISFVWNSIEIDPQWNCIKQSQKKSKRQAKSNRKDECSSNWINISTIWEIIGRKKSIECDFFSTSHCLSICLITISVYFSCLIHKTPFISNGKNDLKKKQRMKTNEKYRISEWIEILLNYFGKKSGRMMWILFYATIKRWAWK